jgi:hypothetical protein
MSEQGIGKAWHAAKDRLPKGWNVTRLSLEPSGQVTQADGTIGRATNVWLAKGAPVSGSAWRSHGKSSFRDAGIRAWGRSPIEALLSLAVRAEALTAGEHPDAIQPPTLDAVDALFQSLFTHTET